MLQGLLKYRQDLLDKIEELKNLPKDMVLISSDPDEKDVNDIIRSIEGTVKLIDILIAKLGNL